MDWRGGTTGQMFFRLTIATMLAAGTSGCAVSPFTVTRPYPVYGNPVNPTPAPGYHVVCGTGYGLGVLMFPSRISHCSQEIAPVMRHEERREVIRVRG
jgi:hypothetical protein